MKHCTKALLLLLLLLTPGPTAAAQEDGVEFAVEPMPGSQTNPGGGYYLIEADPGDAVRQSLGLRNDSDETLQLRIASVDAITGPLGGASYNVPKDAVTRTGAWIDLKRESVSVSPGESAVVPFTVTVPRDATSGEHLAGLAVWAPIEDQGSGGAGENQAGAAVTVQTRRVVAVQVNVPGPAEPELVISDVEPAARPDGLYVEIAIENAGKGLTKGEGVIEIDDDGFEQDFLVDTFVPDTSIAYPVKWTESPRKGDYTARVEIEYGSRTATWEGVITVGDAVLRQLANRGVEAQQASGMPVWLWVALAVAAVAGAGAAVQWRRRATKERSSTGSAQPRPHATQPVTGHAPPPPPAAVGSRGHRPPPPPPLER